MMMGHQDLLVVNMLWMSASLPRILAWPIAIVLKPAAILAPRLPVVSCLGRIIFDYYLVTEIVSPRP